MADVALKLVIGWLAFNAFVAAWAILGGYVKFTDRRFHFREGHRFR